MLKTNTTPIKKLVPKWLKRTKRQEVRLYSTNSKDDLLEDDDNNNTTTNSNNNPKSSKETSSTTNGTPNTHHSKKKLFHHSPKHDNNNNNHNNQKNNNNSSDDNEEALVAWYFDPIPHSFHLWLISRITGTADKEWDLNDELTISATCENIEFYLRHRKLTKQEKFAKAQGVLRAVGVKGTKEVVEEIFQQIEETYLQQTETDNQKRVELQRKNKHLMRESSFLQSSQDSYTKPRSSTIF